MFNINHYKKYWDENAAEKTFTHPLVLENITSYIDQSSIILDYGCGYGRSLNALYEAGYSNLHGIDYSRKMIERGSNDYPALELRHNSLIETHFPNSHFDLVLLFAVLTCNPCNEDQKKIISEIYRILKPGGIIYISDYVLQTDSRNIERYNAFKTLYGRYGVFEIAPSIAMRHHDYDHINNLLAPFAKKHYENIEVKTMNGHSSQGFQYVGMK